MHVQINAELLSKDLKNVAYIVSKLKQDSELSSILLQTSNESLVVTLSNEHDKAIITLPCVVLQQGECFVTAHKFIGVVQSFSQTIELMLSNSSLIVQQDKVKIKLPVVASNPLCSVFSNVTFAEKFTIDGSVLDDMVSTVAPFADVDANSVISGINMSIKESCLRIQACHNAAMAIATRRCDSSQSKQLDITLKTETMQAISKLFSNEDIEVGVVSSIVCFIGHSCVLYTRAIYGAYPPIENIIENDIICDSRISRQLFEKCLRRVLIVKTLCKRLNTSIANQIMTVNYEQSLTEKLPVAQQGQDIRFSVNYEYLLTVLRVLNTSTLNLRITSTSKLQFVDDNNIIIISPLC